MSENKSNKTDKKRSGLPSPLSIATIRATGADTVAVAAADDTVVVTAKRRRVLGGGRGTASTAATTITASTTWTITPIPILILLFQYLDQPGLMNASTVSKQWNRIIHTNPGMAQHRIIPVLKFSASHDKGDKGRTKRLMEALITNRDKLQQYRVLLLLDVNKFNGKFEWSAPFHLDGIESLDLSSPSKLSRVNCDVLHQLSSMLPNLREINLSNIGGDGFDSVLGSFATRCPRLERITWNNIDIDCDISMSGLDMMRATNLREIMMDGSSFETRSIFNTLGGGGIDEISD